MSPELASSDDEWEMAMNDDPSEPHSSASDLSDIEILSRSPSKDTVKIASADDDNVVDVCEFENVEAPSLVDDGSAGSCSDPLSATAAPEALLTPQYGGVLGSCQQGPEIVGVKRKLSRRIKIGAEDWKGGNVASTAVLKERCRGKKMKHASIGSRKTTKQLSKSKAGSIAVVELQIRKSQIVNSESTTDNEEDSPVLRKCNIRKRKRKNNTEKGNCHPAAHHTPVPTESDPESHEKEIAKRGKGRKRDKVEETVRPVCDEVSLRQHEEPDCETVDSLVELKRSAGTDELAGYTQSEKTRGSRTTDQGIKMSRSRLEICDENSIHETPCNLQLLPSAEKSKDMSRRTKKVGDNFKHEDAICYMEDALNPEKVKFYFRGEMEETAKCEISLSPKNVGSVNKTSRSSQIISNPEDRGNYQLIPLSFEYLKSSGKGVTHSEHVGEMRKYAVVPLSEGNVEYPQEATEYCQSARNIDENAEKKLAPCKYKDAVSREEINLTKINNIDGNNRNKVAKRKRKIGVSLQKPPANLKLLHDFSGKNDQEVSVHSLFDVDVKMSRLTRTNSKLTSVMDAKGTEDDILNRLKVVENSKTANTISTTPSKADEELAATASMNERHIPERPGISTHKLVSQIRIPQLGETDCRMLKTAKEVSEHPVGHGAWKEDRPEISSGCMWDITSKAAMNSEIPDGCLGTARKKCLRKVKSRSKKERSGKLHSAKCGLGLAAILPDSKQMKVRFSDAYCLLFTCFLFAFPFPCL